MIECETYTLYALVFAVLVVFVRVKVKLSKDYGKEYLFCSF
jgi:hypothetical protein